MSLIITILLGLLSAIQLFLVSFMGLEDHYNRKITTKIAKASLVLGLLILLTRFETLYLFTAIMFGGWAYYMLHTNKWALGDFLIFLAITLSLTSPTQVIFGITTCVGLLAYGFYYKFATNRHKEPGIEGIPGVTIMSVAYVIAFIFEIITFFIQNLPR